MAASSAPASGRARRRLEKELGFARAKALFDVAEEAKAHLLEFAATNRIEIDFRPGHLNVCHRKRDLPEYVEHAEAMRTRFNYPDIAYMDAAETHERMGSDHYYGGVRDTGTGHIHPLKLVIGTARVAAEAGAKLFENTKATGITTNGGKVIVKTAKGTITAKKCLIAVNSYGGDLEPQTASHIMPIGSFIGATVPLGDDSPVLPGGEFVSDSRFVVRYFRRAKTGELLFGGREIYAPGNPAGYPHPYPAADRRDLSGTEGRQDHPCLGRLCRHHAAEKTLRARGDAERDLGRRLFRPRRDAVELHGQALRRDGVGQPRPAEAVRGAEDPALPRRPDASARRCFSWRSTGTR